MSDRMTLDQLIDRLNDVYGGTDMEIVVEDQNGNAYPIEEVYAYPAGNRYVIGVHADED